jgi:translation initiation factor 2B subunit (eIF-2B alpha/beta/delta family)
VERAHAGRHPVSHLSDELADQLTQNTALSHKLCVAQIQTASMKQLEEVIVNENNLGLTEADLEQMRDQYRTKISSLSDKLSSAHEQNAKIDSDGAKYNEISNSYHSSFVVIQFLNKYIFDQDKSNADLQQHLAR